MSTEWTVPKEALEGACKLIDNVPPRNGIRCSEYIRIAKWGKEGASFELSSDITAKATVKIGQRFPFGEPLYMDRRLFLPFVKGGAESKTTVYKFVQSDEGKMVVRHGSRQASYDKQSPVSGYEEEPTLGNVRSADLDKNWVNLVDAASDCATEDPITPQLNCVFLQPVKRHLQVLAYNGRVMFLGRATKQETLKDNIAFPLTLIAGLKLDNASRLVWDNKTAIVEFPKGKIWQAVKIAARKNFPTTDIQRMIRDSAKDRTVLSINSSTLSGAAHRLSEYVSALSRESLILSLRLTKGSRKVAFESGSEASVFRESFTILEPAEDDLIIEWPLEIVMPVLIFAKDDGVAKINLSKDARSSLHTESFSLIVAKPIKAEPKKRKKKAEKKDVRDASGDE